MKFARQEFFVSAPDGPAGGGAAPAGSSGDAADSGGGDGGQQQSQPVERPEFIPETYWDPQASTIKPEVAEVFQFHQTESEKRAALAARKPEDIKIEVKLPDTVKVPEGVEIKFDDKDPVIQQFRALAIEEALPQQTVDKIVAMRAQMLINEQNASNEYATAQKKALGANADARATAIENWLKAAGLTAAEQKAFAVFTTEADTVRGFEKIMAKLAGTVPGQTPNNPPKPPKPSQEQRWYGQTTPTTAPQQKAS